MRSLNCGYLLPLLLCPFFSKLVKTVAIGGQVPN